MAAPSSSAVHVDTPSGAARLPSGSFICSSCGKTMDNWKNGSCCDDCSVAKYSPSQPRDKDGKFASGTSTSTDDEDDDADPAAPKPRKFVDGLMEGLANVGRGLGGVPLVKETTVPDPTPLYKCSGCRAAMPHWRDGSRCADCGGVTKSLTKAAGAPAKKPAASAAKKPAGQGAAPNVQSEFPSCPSCGEPSKDGRKCEDCRKGVEREHEQGDLTTEEMRANAERSKADSEEEGERRDLRAKVRAAMARMLGLDDMAKAALRAQDLPPMVLKASNQERFSFAPMYMPGKIDAHDEFVKTGDELQKAAWDYVRKTGADRTVYLQHIDQPAGEWVEITSWPYPVEALMTHPGTGQVRKAVLPANTVYMGVVWKPWAWDLVKKGRLLGFSMGGWAKRVQAQLADETVTKASGRARGNGEAWTEAGLVNPDSPAARVLLPPKV